MHLCDRQRLLQNSLVVRIRLNFLQRKRALQLLITKVVDQATSLPRSHHH